MLSDPLGFLLEQHPRLGPIFGIRACHMKLVVMAGERANAFAHGEGGSEASSHPVLPAYNAGTCASFEVVESADFTRRGQERMMRSANKRV
jgi:hypothetical protein